MADADRMLGMYLHLVRASTRRRRMLVRDKLLILAGVHAQEMGLEPISALCRHKILAHNAHHLVRQWPTLRAALADEQFQSYLKQVRRRYSPEKIEHMIDSLGIEMGREREAYFDELEYAAALMDTRPDAIAGILAHDPALGADGVAAQKILPADDASGGAPWLGILPNFWPMILLAAALIVAGLLLADRMLR